MNLRRLRGRFGLIAPRVAIRPHIPWYWRALVTVVLLSGSIALAGWIYDAGRSFAGFDRSESNQQLEGMRGRVEELETELAELRKVANVSESSLQIERTTQLQLGDQVRKLERENGQLKEELAVFENLAGNGAKGTAPGISRFDLEPDESSGRCRFHLLVTAGIGRQDRVLDAKLQLVVTVIQGGKAVMLRFPAAHEMVTPSFNLSFRRYLRQEGTIQLPVGAKIIESEALLVVGDEIVASKKVIF